MTGRLFQCLTCFHSAAAAAAEPIVRGYYSSGQGDCACAGLTEQVNGQKVATTGTAGCFDCDFWKRLTKALPPVGGVASSSTPQTVQ